MSTPKFIGGMNPVSMSDRELAERFMDGGQDSFDDLEEFDDAVSNLEFLLRAVRAAGKSSAPNLAARLETALGLLRELHANMNHRLSCECRTGKFLATVDADTDSAGRRGG